MFQGDLFGALGIEVPQELKTEAKVDKKEKAKEKAKAIKAVSKAISKKPAVETYVRLPVTVVYGFDKIELDVADFEESIIVRKLERPENPAAQEKQEDASLLESCDKENEEDNVDVNEEKDTAAEEKNNENTAKKTDDSDEYLYDENIPKVTLEVLRERLEEDYPAFSKERTSMQYDKEKNIVVPVITKGSLGCLQDNFIAINNKTGETHVFYADSFSVAYEMYNPLEYALIPKFLAGGCLYA